MKTFHRYIFFTKTRLDGFFGIDDLFQIYPVQIEGTPSSSIQKHFPNFIEFFTSDEDKVKLETPFPEMDDVISRMAAPYIKEDMFLYLLTTGTNHLFFRYEDMTGNWGVPITSANSSDNENTSSDWYHPIYTAKVLENSPFITQFTNLSIPPVQRKPYQEYYFGVVSHDKHYSDPITVPNTLKAFIESYLLLPPEDRIVVNNAMLHLKKGIEISELKKTLALISFFTCLETLVNLSAKDVSVEKCSCCQQLKYSVTKKFRDFLTTYVSNDTASKKKFNQLYSLRSKIIHTGEVLESELLYSEIPYEERKTEELQIREVIQICRVAIFRWVIETVKHLPKSDS